MNAFDVIIENKLVNDYVNINSLEEISQEAEGDEILNFRVDSASIEMDITVLDFLGYDVKDYSDLYKKKCEIYYFGNLILQGHIGEISLNFEFNNITFGFYSIAKIVSAIELQFVPYAPLSIWTSSSITVILKQLLRQINVRISNTYHYWFTLNENPIVDTDNFVPLRGIDLVEIAIPKPIINNVEIDIYEYIYKKQKQYYLVSSKAVIANQVKIYILYQIGSDGSFIGYVPFILTSAYSFEDFLGRLKELQYEPAQDWEDKRVVEAINAVMRLDDINNNNEETDPEIMSKAKLSNDLKIALIKHHGVTRIIKIQVSDRDKLLFFFGIDKWRKAGDILKEIATLTNSLIYITPSRRLKLQKRDNTDTITILNPQKLDSELLDRTGYEIDVPTGYFFTDETEQEIIEYYQSYFNGLFYKYSVTFIKSDVDFSQAPFISKKLVTNIYGSNLNLGIIKEVIYSEDLITFRTEKRIS